MDKALLVELAGDFIRRYAADTKDRIWQQQSATFRNFWQQKVLGGSSGEISDESCDQIIRILDCNGKGNTKDSESVARVLVPQNAWRKLFNVLHTNEKLADLVNSVLNEENLDLKITLINKLYKENENERNRLTGPSGSVLNAFLAAYDPVKNLSTISLKHRKAQMDFLQIGFPFNWEDATIGQRIVQSNLLLLNSTKELGFHGTARTISEFWYDESVRRLWDSEDTVKRIDKEVTVSVPSDKALEEIPHDDSEIRESLQIQAALAEIGSQMGFQIWLPRADRARVLTKWKPAAGVLMESLPVGFDPATMKTIEQIDVLWLKRRSIVRAFEVEHTTSVYSGLLRMADLLAMQPNLKINLHIVAPPARRDKVLQEIRRPVFALLEGGALSETCTYLSYDTITDLRKQPHLSHLSDNVIEDYAEKADSE